MRHRPPPPPDAIAALLGRFLPRLGPLVATQAAFSFLCMPSRLQQFRASVGENAGQWAALRARAVVIENDECSSWNARLPATTIRVVASTSRSAVSDTRCAQ